MNRGLIVGALAFAVVATAAMIVGPAGGASKATMAQAKAAGWDCSPEILILGYYHCAPPRQAVRRGRDRGDEPADDRPSGVS
jgi:hypothetical protein